MPELDKLNNNPATGSNQHEQKLSNQPQPSKNTRPTDIGGTPSAPGHTDNGVLRNSLSVRVSIFPPGGQSTPRSVAFEPVLLDRQPVELVALEDTVDLLTDKLVSVRRTYPGTLVLPSRSNHV